MSYADRGYGTDAENLRAARMSANGGSYTEAEFQAQLQRQRWRCYNPFCQCDLRAPGVVAHRDHLRPVAKGGTSNIDNIRGLCGACNQRKHAKPWNVFMVDEGRRAIDGGDLYGPEGQHASDIGRQEYGGQGSAHFGSAPGSAAGGFHDVRHASGWSWLSFLGGLLKGAIAVPAIALSLCLVFMAAAGKGRRGSRVVEGAVGAFGAWRAWSWAWSGDLASRLGVLVGGAIMALVLANMHPPADTGDAVTETATAAPAASCEGCGTPHIPDPNRRRTPLNMVVPDVPDVRVIVRGESPAAVRPLTMAPRWSAPIYEAPRPRANTPPAGVAMAANAPRRNIGCGWWPVGSDADRDCAAGRMGR